MKNLKRCFPLFLLVLFPPACLCGQEGQAGALFLSKPQHQAQFAPLEGVTGTKYWDRGYLIAFELEGTSSVSPTKPAVVLYDRNGHPAREATVWFDQAIRVSVPDAAITPTGKLLIAAGMSDPSGNFSNYIAEIDETGHVGRRIRTPDFLPLQICTTGDGSVWGFGADRYAQPPPAKMCMLRRFSFGKGQTQAMLDWSTLNFSAWNVMDNRAAGLMRLHCTSKKIGLLNWKSQEWIEFDIPRGTLKTVRITPLPEPQRGGASLITGSVLSEAGEVFVSVFYRSRLGAPTTSGIYKLKVDSNGGGTWVPVAGSFDQIPNRHAIRLLGADGSALVYSWLEGTAFWSNIEKR